MTSKKKNMNLPSLFPTQSDKRAKGTFGIQSSSSILPEVKALRIIGPKKQGDTAIASESLVEMSKFKWKLTQCHGSAKRCTRSDPVRYQVEDSDPRGCIRIRPDYNKPTSAITSTKTTLYPVVVQRSLNLVATL